jgi:AcrR family transcriptional regulator
MTQKTLRKPVKDRMIDAALDLAREESWSNIDFAQICLAANVSEDQALEFFDDKTDILVAYGRRTDAELRAVAHEILSDEMSEREKLFDLLMERFELINDNREAILSILGSIKTDPKEAVLTFPHLAKSMTRILELAGLETEGFKGAAQVTGLTGVYLYTVRTWKEDETSDLSKTMATLDKALDYAESTANSFLNGNVLSGFSDFKDRFKNKGE